MSSVDLFVDNLPLVSYNVQQVLIEALTKAASTQPPEFADRLLPLTAAGSAATRTAVMKIFLGMGDRRDVVKRYIRFTQKLAGFVRDRAIESIRPRREDLSDPLGHADRARGGDADLRRGPARSGAAGEEITGETAYMAAQKKEDFEGFVSQELLSQAGRG